MVFQKGLKYGTVNLDVEKDVNFDIVSKNLFFCVILGVQKYIKKSLKWTLQ